MFRKLLDEAYNQDNPEKTFVVYDEFYNRYKINGILEKDYDKEMEKQRRMSKIIGELEARNKINKNWEDIVKYGADEDFFENKEMCLEIKNLIRNKNINFGTYYYPSASSNDQDYIEANLYGIYEDEKYYLMRIVFGSPMSKKRIYFQLFNSNGNTVIYLSDDITYLGHNCFFREYNGKTSLIKNDEEYINQDIIKKISTTSNDNHALFYDKIGNLGIIDLNNSEPYVEILKSIHPLSRLSDLYTVNNQFHFEINNTSYILDSIGNVLFKGSNSEYLVTLKEDGIYVTNKIDKSERKIEEEKPVTKRKKYNLYRKK